MRLSTHLTTVFLCWAGAVVRFLQDCFLIGLPTMDLQHKQLFIILKKFADVAFTPDMPNKKTELVCVFSSPRTALV